MSRTHCVAVLLFLVASVVYTIPITYNEWIVPFFHMVPAQDVVSASLLPMSILTRGDFYLDQYRRYITNNYPEPYFVAEVNNHLVTRYTAMPGILAIPVIGAARGTGWITQTNIVFSAAKLAAALITAFTLVAFFYAARRLTDLSTSTWMAVAFAFGTGVWSTASQGLWQHTPSILFQTIALGFLLRGLKRGAEAAAPAGLFFAFAVITRPPTFAIAATMTIFFLLQFRPAFWKFALWSLPPILFALYYNTTVNSSPLSFGYQDVGATNFHFPQWNTIWELLFLPSRGVFVYSPFLLLVPIGVWLGWRTPRRNFFLFLVLASIIYTGVMAAWGSLGGWAYGARMLTDILPQLALLIIPVIEKFDWRGKLVLGVSVAIAIFLQALGIWDYGLRFHADPTNSLYSFENSEPIYYLRLYFAMIQEALGF